MTTVDISICPTELPEDNGCGDTPTPGEVLDALREFVGKTYPKATIRCLQIGHRQGDGWAAIDGNDEAGAIFMENFWDDFN